MGTRYRAARPGRLELAIAAALLAAGAAAGAASSGESWSARAVAAGYLGAMTRGDVAEHRRLSTPDHGHAVTVAFCKARHARIRHVYDVVIPELARPRWEEVRREAEQLARGEEERLRVLIQERGQAGIGSLSVDALNAITNHWELRQRFVYECGASQLDRADRELVGDPETFRTDPDDDGFVVRAAWSVLPEERRRELGSPKVLARGDSPEKLAWFDAVAQPLLAPRSITRTVGAGSRATAGGWLPEDCDLVIVPGTPGASPGTETSTTRDWASVVRGVSREDVASLDDFIRTHGDETVHDALLASLSGPPSPEELAYVAEERGSLFRGSQGLDRSRIGVRGAPQLVACTLDRQGLKWAVSDLSLDLERLGEAAP